ncbi:TonB-dependent receptor [Pseudokordiimonas caeni]|uniref:TonB-dependent receptor n=1 Tax=Pseudokordiimonas caeni TaxID=2997908 RepID=UPI0028122990|nr:TonB-dependent receptor [Pseudokordiimonas caeni]
MMTRTTVARLLASSCLLGMSSAALAQEAGQSGNDFTLEEIVVTAQMRSQSVQDVPIAVTAMSENMMKMAGVDDLKELSQLAPSLQASSTNSEAQGTVIRLRGIGTQGNNAAFESAVGVFIDGIYRSRAGAALTEILDLERVEVLRGPQGTLFGRNTSAGAINIVTKQPEFEAGGYLEGTYGNYNAFDVRGSVTGPIVDDKLAFRLSSSYVQQDGWMTDTISGDDLNSKGRFQMKGQLLWTPNEDVRLRVIADYRDVDEDCCYAVPYAYRGGIAGTIINAIMPGAQTMPADPESYEAQMTSGPDRPNYQKSKDWGLATDLSWNLGEVELKWISAYREFESNRGQDIDFTGADLLYLKQLNNIDMFTQELRLSGQNGRLDWVVGAFYSDEEIGVGGDLFHGADYEAFLNARTGPLIAAVFAGPTGGLVTNWSSYVNVFSGGAIPPGTGWGEGTGVYGDTWLSKNKSYSLFTHNVIELTEKLDMIFGLRFTRDEKHAESNLSTPNTPGCNFALPRLAQLPIAELPLGAVLGTDDVRRVIDVLATLGCLGITSASFDIAEEDQDLNDSEFSGVLGLSYQFDDDTMIYGNVAHGYKSGTINLDRAGTILTRPGDNTDPRNYLSPQIGAEEVDSFEVGMKKTMFDNRAQVNVALYYMDFDNFQLNTFNGSNFLPEAIEDVKTKGFEVETQARFSESFDMMLGVAYSKADYGDNLPATVNILKNDRFGTNYPEVSGLSGQQLTNAPRWVLTGGATWHKEVSDGMEFFISGNVRYQTKINTGSDLDPEKLQKGFALVNSRVGIQDVDGKWSVELWANNLFNQFYQQNAFDIPLQADDGFGAFLGQPRMYGITGRFRF